MKFVTIDQLRTHCKADDSSQDDQLTLYGNAAEQEVQRMANRTIFATDAERTAAVQAVPGTMAAAYTTYDAAIAAANSEADVRNRTFQMQLANDALLKAQVDADQVAFGIVVTDDIRQAVLLIAGRSFQLRADTVDVPAAAAAIMSRYTHLGPL